MHRLPRMAAIFAVSTAAFAASFPRIAPEPDFAPVVETLAQLRTSLKIPGLAAAIVRDGQVVWRGNWGNLDTTTPRDIASITKTMAAVIALQQVERGQLGLQDPVAGLPGVQVRHLLSHTSVGRPGESFAYNNGRYGALTQILEQSAHEKFAQLLRSRIFEPAGMTASAPGTSSISGVMSSVEDLARYASALEGDCLLGERRKQWMWMPMGAALPYALGWYSQSYRGQRVVWHYGQLNGYGSSLIVKLPELRANLVVLSNSSLLSDAYHLESGDITLSPLGRSFLAALVEGSPAHQESPVSSLTSIGAVPFAVSRKPILKAAAPRPLATPRAHPSKRVARHRRHRRAPLHTGL